MVVSSHGREHNTLSHRRLPVAGAVMEPTCAFEFRSLWSILLSHQNFTGHFGYLRMPTSVQVQTRPSQLIATFLLCLRLCCKPHATRPIIYLNLVFLLIIIMLPITTGLY